MMQRDLYLEAPQFRLLISKEEISLKIKEAASELSSLYAGRVLHVILLMKGALCVGADLLRELTCRTVVHLVECSSYGSHGMTSGTLSIKGLEHLDIAHEDVLVVDDIFDTGKTLSTVVRALEQQAPSSVSSFVLLRKKIGRDLIFSPKFVLFEIDNLFVVGYGMDYKEHYRGLNGIYELSK